MKKAIAIAISVVALSFAVSSTAGASPTQQGSLYCTQNGYTSFSANSAVDYVEFFWYKNSTTQVGYYGDYWGPYWGHSTPNAAKTAKARVWWNGQAGYGYTDYSKACT